MQTQPIPNRSRFDCFIKLRPGTVSHLPERKRTWCYRGDKFTDQENLMIRNLVKFIIKKAQDFSIIELYDNSQPPADPARIILRLFDGVIEKNLLNRDPYKSYLTNLPLPEWLQS